MWIAIDDSEQQIVGQRYRSLMTVNLDYATTVPLLQAQFRLQSTLNKDFTITAFGDQPPLWNERAGKLGPYVFWYEYTVNPEGANVSEAGISPWIFVALAAAVVATITAVALTDRHFEKFVTDETDKLASAVPAVTPSLATIGILVVVALFLIFHKGG